MRMRVCAFLAGVLGLSCVTAGQDILVDFTQPDLDRWVYPFNFSPGTRASGSVFSAFAEPNFDVRDAQILLGFESVSQVPTGQGLSSYQITSAVLQIAVTSSSTFVYDDTFDPWQSTLLAADPEFVADLDAGRPLELYGAGYRSVWTAATYLESSPFRDIGGANYRGVRNVFATDFNTGIPRDISNHTDDRFQAFPFAIGQSILTPGDAVPVNTQFTFTIDLSNPDAVLYLRSGLNDGKLRFVLSSLMPAVFDGGAGGTGEVASFYMREDFFASGLSGRLTMDVRIGSPADLTGDGVVDGADLGILLGAWGVGVGGSADLNGDGDIDGADLGILLGAWG